MEANERRFTIGREITCDVPTADDSVGRLHAQLSILEGDHLFLVDCQSTNGTSILRGGVAQPVRQEFVTPGDEVCFGGVTIAVEDILSVIRQKHRIPSSAQFPSPRRETPPEDAAVCGKRLVRCICGSIKAKGDKCKTCGG